MAKWSKALPLTARLFLPLLSRVRLLTWVCEKVATDLMLGGGFRRVLRFSTTIYNRLVPTYPLLNMAEKYEKRRKYKFLSFYLFSVSTIKRVVTKNWLLGVIRVVNSFAQMCVLTGLFRLTIYFQIVPFFLKLKRVAALQNTDGKTRKHTVEHQDCTIIPQLFGYD